MNEPTAISLSHLVEEAQHGLRFDQVAAQAFPDYSREKLKSWISSGELCLNGAHKKPKDKVQMGDSLKLEAVLSVQTWQQAEDIALDVVFEDEHLLVINKPAGLVVHPGAGNPNGTLVNALLAYLPSQSALPRAGIVHRLDKDTTGLMVVAKSLQAHTGLVRDLQARVVKRQYLALVQGLMIAGDTIEANIGRHPVHRTKMAVVSGGKFARTHYRVNKKLGPFTLVDVKLDTGRTHQIRVHMSHIGFPLVGDALYFRQKKLQVPIDSEKLKVVRQFPRQALHATKLSLNHPATGQLLSWQAKMPQDMDDLVRLLHT